MKTPQFLSAFTRTMIHEGYDSNDIDDPGGETYRGISKVFWPMWAGWTILARVRRDNFKTDTELLQSAVENFYLVNFWNQVRGDEIAEISAEIAEEVFDTAVNTGIQKAGKILQEALNLLNLNQLLYPDIHVDGVIGIDTIETLRRYFSLKTPVKNITLPRLLKVMNALQAEHYINLMRKFPEREKFRGWFERI